MTPSLFHAGDLGDIIASLPIARALGGADILIGPGYCRESMAGTRFESIKPLLEAQTYVRSVKWVESTNGATHDLSRFRDGGSTAMPYGESLAHIQARYLGVKIDTEPWLVSSCLYRHGDVIFARSGRYHNPCFPWFNFIRKYPDAIFVGLRSEYEAFMSEFSGAGAHDLKGFKNRIRFEPCGDLLSLATVISGASLFIGNQSCPFWIAIGLGVPVIQETWEPAPNSMIERHNAIYTLTRPYELGL